MSTRASRHLKDLVVERHLFRLRAWTGFGLLLLALLGLSGRYFWLQVAQHDQFSTRARANRVQLRPLPPPRGLIFDRNGVLLADNKPAFRLQVTPENVEDMDAMLERLDHLVPLTQSDLEAFHEQLASHRAFQHVPLKFDLNPTEMATFAANSWRFPGVRIKPYLTRVYPLGRYFSHVIGYVGRIDANDMRRRDAKRYAGTTHIGKTGLERYYESLLHGEPGYELAEVNVDQRPLRVLERHPPEPGKSLVLTIDAHLQKVAAEALGDEAGAVVAIDPRNGEILAMVSRPGFNPNLFVNGISHKAYDALLHDPGNPLFNRALRGTYMPGSTIKPFMGLAGLEMGLREPSDEVYSSGVWHIPGVERGYRDDRRGGNGWVNLREAIQQSVNTYFYQLAYDMGIDRLSAFMQRFGFGEPTGVDLIGESSGIRPSRQWKRAHRSKPWFQGETVIAGIGQGYWAVTPLQLAHAVATLAAGGVSHKPHLLLGIRDGVNTPTVPVPPPEPVVVDDADPEAYAAVRDGMVAVVNTLEGTASHLGDGFPYTIAGKTGTAERYSRDTDAYHNLSAKELNARHIALFIAYTPVKDPRIVVTVVVDHGAWGSSAAAPIARKVMDAWLQSQHHGAASSEDTPEAESQSQPQPQSESQSESQA